MVQNTEQGLCFAFEVFNFNGGLVIFRHFDKDVTDCGGKNEGLKHGVAVVVEAHQSILVVLGVQNDFKVCLLSTLALLLSLDHSKTQLFDTVSN